MAFGVAVTHAQVIPLDATVAVYAEAKVAGIPLQYDRTTEQADSNFDPINLFAHVTASSDTSTADAFTSISAVWNAPDLGSVQFGDTGFATMVTEDGALVDVDGTRWTYRFRTTSAGQFAITYKIDFMDGTTDQTGLGGFRIVVLFGDYLPVFDQTVPPGDAGVLTIPLAASSGYTVSIIPIASLNGNLGMRLAGMDASFDWQVISGDYTKGVQPGTLRKCPNTRARSAFWRRFEEPKVSKLDDGLLDVRQKGFRRGIVSPRQLLTDFDQAALAVTQFPDRLGGVVEREGLGQLWRVKKHVIPQRVCAHFFPPRPRIVTRNLGPRVDLSSIHGSCTSKDYHLPARSAPDCMNNLRLLLSFQIAAGTARL
jgi:hypothetical protein